MDLARVISSTVSSDFIKEELEGSSCLHKILLIPCLVFLSAPASLDRDNVESLSIEGV